MLAQPRKLAQARAFIEFADLLDYLLEGIIQLTLFRKI